MHNTITEKIAPLCGLEQTLIEAGLDRKPFDFDEQLQSVTVADVDRELSAPAKYSHRRLLALISPAARERLEQMAQAAHAITLQRFGRVMGLYAPVYVSNYCLNQCRYCGFNCHHQINRKRLTVEEAQREAAHLVKLGYQDILLVSGEDAAYVNVAYLAELVRRIKRLAQAVSLEIYPLDEAGYLKLIEAGADGITLYQETYDRALYDRWHDGGPKADYSRRLRLHEDAAKAGMRRLGIGALLGLGDWRFEALALGAHAKYLMKHYWRSRVAFSFCRMRPAAGVDLSELRLMSDAEHVQMITAMRLCFPDAALYLSTRERAEFRDRLIHLGITNLSAGSSTSPGGYTDADATGQFDVNDTRSPAEVAAMLSRSGYEPVWKDWDRFNS